MRDYGFTESDIPAAAQAILPAVPPRNPRPVMAGDLDGLLRAAWQGADPAAAGLGGQDLDERYLEAEDLDAEDLGAMDLVRRGPGRERGGEPQMSLDQRAGEGRDVTAGQQARETEPQAREAGLAVPQARETEQQAREVP